MNRINEQVAAGIRCSARSGNYFRKRVTCARDRYHGRTRSAPRASPSASFERGWPPSVRDRAIYLTDVLRTLADLLGHAAPARQPACRAPEGGSAIGAAFRLRTILDARTFGSTGELRIAAHRYRRRRQVDATPARYLVIDPRAGHGPGIGS